MDNRRCGGVGGDNRRDCHRPLREQVEETGVVVGCLKNVFCLVGSRRAIFRDARPIREGTPVNTAAG